MKFRDKPELIERLAAEYALGTLRGGARRRFDDWMRQDASVALAVARWQGRLAPLLAHASPVEPPARLWRAIEAQIGPGTRTVGFWESLAFWRNFGLAAGGMAAALLVSLMLLAPQPQPSAPAPAIVQVPARGIPASYLAVLSDPKTQRPVLVAWAERRSDQLQLTTLDPAIQVPGKSLELWALPASGAPRSLGLVAAGNQGSLKLVAAADESLGAIPALAISLEPAGGSPSGAPTGPVLFTGPCVKYW